MISQEQAEQIAQHWIADWNSHDIERIMNHYAEEIYFTSPVIVQVMNDPSGTIRNKTDLKVYFSKALGIYTDLHFTLYKTLVCINSIVLYYKTINNKVTAEYMELNEKGEVTRVCAHYAMADQ